MKLADATNLSLYEASIACDSIVILEDGEGPRWKFAYDNWHHDPNPDILLLGSWRHPSTQNNLVGGINLHYLNDKQRDSLARILPKIMGGGNLKDRYWIGREALPDVFNNFYRTYNANFIRGVRKDVMFPKFGFMKTAQNWIKKKLGGILKSKEQRAKEAEPKYPEDLGRMQDKLDQVVLQLQAKDATDAEPEIEDTPEMQAARSAFQDYQREKTMAGIQQKENQPLQAAQQDIKQQDVVDQLQQQQQQQNEVDLAAERRQNQEELLNPNNEIDLSSDEIDLSEAIRYYSPTLGRYVIEEDNTVLS